MREIKSFDNYPKLLSKSSFASKFQAIRVTNQIPRSGKQNINLILTIKQIGNIS